MRAWIFGFWIFSSALSILTGPTIAGPVCTGEPKSKWLSESDMTAKIAALGFTFKALKTTAGNCYEIYGRDKTGKRIEVYFNPVTGAMVEEHKS